MNKKFYGVCLLILFSGLHAMTDNPDDDAIFAKFLDYTQKVYFTHAQEDLIFGDHLVVLNSLELSSRVLGYSLGNLLRYARRGSDNHKIWLMLESKTKQDMLTAIEREGELRGWDRKFIDNRKQKAWQQCMAAQQGWFDQSLIIWTSVEAKDAPDFFEILRTGIFPGEDTDITDRDTGNEDRPVIENPSVLSDEILGKWTWTHEYTVPHTDRIVRQKLSVVVRRTGTEERLTGGGPLTDYLYEGYVFEIENVTDEWSRPLAKPGDLCWKIKYTSSHRLTQEDSLGYTFDSLLDRMGSFGLRLRRNQGIIEIGNAKYYR